MKTYFCCKHCGRVEVMETDREGKDEMVLNETCSVCRDNAVVDAVVGCTNLKALLNRYNKYDFLFDDGGLMELGQMHSFKFSVIKHGKNVMLKIWDETEHFNIDTDQELYWAARSAAAEFGFRFKIPNSKIEEVQKELKEAIKKDFKVKEDFVIEWEDGVVMSAYLEGVE